MSNDSEWNDDELVSLSELRPSHRVYGPGSQAPQQRNPRAKSAQPRKSQQPANSERPAQRQQAQQPQPRRQGQGGQGQGGQGQGGQGQQRQPQQGQGRQQRPSSQGQSNPQARQQRPVRQSAEQRPARRPQPQQQPRRRTPNEDEFANNLAESDRSANSNAASSGWRGALQKVSGGVINVGPSTQEKEMVQLHRQLRRPVTNGTIAVFSRKGGVGKTTISAYLGLTMAAERGGRIVVLDGDAEAGSLGWLLAPKAPSTLAALASANPIPNDYASLRRFTTATPEGLEVIVGDPAEMGPISTTGLEAVASQLARHYDISIFDTGAGVTRATGRVLVNTARTLLLVMSPSVDSVRAAERTLAWLDERPGEAARENANVIAVINGIPANAKRNHVERIESHFNERCSAVVRIPWDQHLATGSSSVSLDLLSRPTREAFVELAATTISTLGRPVRKPNARRRELSGAGSAY